ncbi:MAG TPA: hypothetical protein VFN89_05005 [Solirubrobacterales bacterium]|nr:hypothetical protein [Solirubrobacterales bacterium]
MQQAPTRYVERRVEHLDLPDDYHYGVRVTQQLVIPHHGPEGDAGEQPGARDLLVPLGQFSKDRMPGLRVVGPDGLPLPLLSRTERGYVGATLFRSRWQGRFFDDVDAKTLPEAERLWRIDIHIAVSQIVMRSEREAKIQVYRLSRYLAEYSEDEDIGQGVRDFARSILEEDEFWRDLNALAETRLLTAKMQGEPGRTYVVTVEYTERFHYQDLSRMSPSHLLGIALVWLGLVGMQIARSVANLGQAASLWIVQSVPEGAEALRYYWEGEKDIVRPLEPISVESTRAVVSRRHEQSENDLLLLDVQLSPSSTITATIALAAILLVVSTYVFQALPDLRTQPHGDERAILVALGSLFSAIPAGIVGGLAYRGQTFIRRASRGPRVLVAVLAAQAMFFAIVVSLKNLGDLTEVTAYALSLYSLFIIGIFGFIQLGPRWRKHERSRRKKKTAETSPNRCRRNQIWQALGFLLVWTIVLLVFGRSQMVLQHSHFFTPEFPGNVWHAWWSWFGLLPVEEAGVVQCSASIC